jgi:riboflavin synthase
MFTGIIGGIGELAAREGGRFTIASDFAAANLPLGASVACDGACLTVTKVRGRESGSEFSVDVSNETLACTTLDEWRPGRKINLERALKAGDELGGHLVAGHVDGLGRLQTMRPDGAGVRLTVEAAPELLSALAPKGSVALDGISLTVNAVDAGSFGVMIIPHTLTHTTLRLKKPGDRVNLEVDLVSRYVARALEFRR